MHYVCDVQFSRSIRTQVIMLTSYCGPTDSRTHPRMHASWDTAQLNCPPPTSLGRGKNVINFAIALNLHCGGHRICDSSGGLLCHIQICYILGMAMFSDSLAVLKLYIEYFPIYSGMIVFTYPFGISVGLIESDSIDTVFISMR